MTRRSQEQRRRQELKRDRRRRARKHERIMREAAWHTPVKHEKKIIQAALVRRQIAQWRAEQAARAIEKKYGHTNREMT
jgi:hypothetical protein